MEKFTFGHAENNRTQLDTSDVPEHVWDDYTARTAVRNDGTVLVVHLPASQCDTKDILIPLSGILQMRLEDLVQNLGGRLPKCAGADQEGRGRVSSYKDITGQIAGMSKLVKAWHAIGHTHEDPTMSRDVLRTGRSFSASFESMSQLHLVSHRVKDMIKYADPAHYAALKELQEEAERIHKFLKVIGSDDPLLMKGREIMYNRQTPVHRDKFDHKRGGSSSLSLDHSPAHSLP
ncbi:hypothetical protein DFH09DRAFT_1083212 [Mycena vulgaris]|nr:hypothetical protein DFH09DRAFT_1083212 [Mycena vulgaris]